MSSIPTPDQHRNQTPLVVEPSSVPINVQMLLSFKTVLYEENTQSQKLKSITLRNFNMVSELDEPSMASVSPSPIHQSLPSSQSISVAFPSTLPSASIQLNRSNYNIWRSQILPTVRAYDLENYLLGTVTPPVSS